MTDKPKRDGVTKTCPECYLIVYSATRECKGCGYEFFPAYRLQYDPFTGRNRKVSKDD